MEDESNYYKSSGGIIPLKWTAPEVCLILQCALILCIIVHNLCILY